LSIETESLDVNGMVVQQENVSINVVRYFREFSQIFGLSGVGGGCWGYWCVCWDYWGDWGGWGGWFHHVVHHHFVFHLWFGWMSGSGMMVVNVCLMMRLVMRALITVMILWRMVMIGHVRIISGLCVMSCMVYGCSRLMRNDSMMNRGSMVGVVGNGSMVDGVGNGSMVDGG